MLKMAVMNRTFFQVVKRGAVSSCAPTAKPMRPMMRPTAIAASAPTQTALQIGQGRQVSYSAIEVPPAVRETASSVPLTEQAFDLP